MKTKLTLTLLVALAFFVAIPAAYAATNVKVFSNGVTAVTTTGVTPIVSGTTGRLASGSGGTPSSSGSCTAWVKTRYYSISGATVLTYKTLIYWEWSNGSITNKHWLAPQQTTPAPFTYYVNTTNGDFGWQTWNGKSQGMWYGSRQGHFVQQITKLGTIKRWHPLHEYWIRGDGTYTWHAHP